MKTNLFLSIALFSITSTTLAQQNNDLFEKIDPYKQNTTPPTQGSNQAVAQPGYPSYPTQPQVPYPYQPPGAAGAYPPANSQAPGVYAPGGGYNQAPQQGNANTGYYPPYQAPTPVNQDAIKVFGNGVKDFFSGQAQPQTPQTEPPTWQDPSIFAPEKEEKTYQMRLQEEFDKPLPKRPTSIGDDHLDELRNRINDIKVPKASGESNL